MKPLVVVLVQVALYGLLGSVEGKIKEGECEGERTVQNALPRSYNLLAN